MPIPSLIIPSIAIAGSPERFPVRRIFCVGQNYADHAREMGSDSTRNPPFFFTKPADAVIDSGFQVPFPRRTQDLHHEVEMVVALGSGGVEIDLGRALSLIFGWAVGIDLTRRDLQSDARKAGRPWDMAKGFDRSAPVGALVVGLPPTMADIELRVSGELRQKGNVADMIWAVPEIIAELSTYVELAAGDLIFTGTPAGVGALQRGDSLSARITGAPAIDLGFV